MSSTYRILCLSHDPALIIDTPDWHRPQQAEEAIHHGINGHTTCDLAIGRYSYPLVELGCPPSRDQPANPGCYHSATIWISSDWLRLLTTAYQSTDPAIQQTITNGRHRCLPWERLKRLHAELGITIRDQQPQSPKTTTPDPGQAIIDAWTNGLRIATAEEPRS